MQSLNIAIFLFALIGIGYSRILEIENAELDYDPNYSKSVLKLIEVDGVTTVNLDIDVSRTVDGMIYQAIVYEKDVDGHYKVFYRSRFENDCHHEAVRDPVLKEILAESRKYGNVTDACPLTSDTHYEMRNFVIDTDDITYFKYLNQGNQYRYDIAAFVTDSWYGLLEIYKNRYYFTA